VTENSDPSHPHPEPRTYGPLALRPLNQLVVIAPLLLFFHFGASRFGSGLLVPHFMRVAFEWLGASGHFLPPLLIATVLMCQHVMSKSPWRVDCAAIGGIIVESIVWTLPLLTAGWIIGSVQAGAAADNSAGTEFLPACFDAVGAGIYEEFLFRLVLIQAAAILFIDLAHLPKNKVKTGAIIASALIFSACHFSAAQLLGSEAMQWPKFVFLATAGAWWSVLFLWRGYGVAACCHICWNITVMLQI
jgi:membrane protease YdiL (CAAX protease family)